MKNLFLMIVLAISVTGCSKSDVSGDVYIIKGDGSIAPSPGREIYFLDSKTEQAFFESITNEAIAEINKDLMPALISQCSLILDSASEAIIELSNELGAVRDRNTVPVGGCSSLDAGVVKQQNKVSSLKSDHDAKLSELRSKRATKQAQKDSAVNELSQSLYNTELEKIQFKWSQGQNGSLNWSLTNESELCVEEYSFKVAFYAGDVEVQTGSAYQFDKMKDEYGFEVPSCHLWKGRSVGSSQRGVAPNPEVKKAISMGTPNIATMKCGYDGRSDCVKITSGKSTTYVTFMEIQKTESGSTTNYSATSVDWSSRALKSGTIASYDRSIASVDNEISQLVNTYNSNAVVADYAAIQESVLACAADEPLIENLEWTMTTANEAIPKLQNCQSDAITPKGTASIPLINALLGLGYDIPTGTPEFKAKFLSKILAKIENTELKAETSIQGHYDLKEVPKGSYLILGRYADSFVNGFWMDAVNVEETSEIKDLNMNTFVNVPFEDYLTMVADSICDNCLAETRTSITRSEIIKDFEEVEKVREQMEEITKELEELMRKLGK